ncbi:MAG TPA: ATP-binding protein [Candidatus Hydrogenedentes bacterium]|nr:ATP-binding protein [Candidatus Hydrogenedentota bacterium]
MLTERDIRAIAAAGETFDIEFKGERQRQFSDTELVEAVVCLANRTGNTNGYLLIGIEDDGSITGARPRHEGNTDPKRLQSLIANRTRPSLTVLVSIVPVDALTVIAVEVPSQRSPVGTADGKYVRRALKSDGKPECVPYAFHEMQSWQADRGLLDYSTLTLPGVSWADLDPLEFDRFRRAIRESRGRGDSSLPDLSDVELAKALGAVEANHEVRAIRVLGLLLFGREDVIRTCLPTHETAFQALSGTKVATNDFFRWPLLRIMEELESRFRARNKEEEILFGLLRIGIPDYPEAAFREAVANAFIHRDYSRLGAVHIQWHEDRMEISSPGGFPEGIRLDNLLVAPPRPRNPLLADAFKRAGIVERTGRGIDTIFFEQLRNGRPAPSYGRSSETNVVLVLPGGQANLDFARLVAEEQRLQRLLSLDELIILNEVWGEREVNTQLAAQTIQKTESETRGVLQRLVEAGLLEARGERKGRIYHLSSTTYRRLGENAAYVRQRGFEPFQQEQMVLQYARTHGRITRNEAANLCQIAPSQAYRLLHKLLENGHLQKFGVRKGTWYEPRA